MRPSCVSSNAATTGLNGLQVAFLLMFGLNFRKCVLRADAFVVVVYWDVSDSRLTGPSCLLQAAERQGGAAWRGPFR